jgi:YD repeat-containing protein
VLAHRLRNGGTESNEYDGRGLRTSHADPLGNVTTYNYDAHRRIARVTLSVWMYVSVTGVLVYFMLYRWFPAA